METKYITFQAYKGGVGKSTLAMIIATHLFQEGKKVLVVDTDFQTSIYSLRLAEIKEAETEGQKIPVGFDVEPFVSSHPDTFRNYLMQKDGKYDYIIIDTPGATGEGEKEFLVALSHLIIIPIIASKLDLESTMKFLVGVNDVLGEKKVPLIGIVNKEDNTKEQTEVLDLNGFQNLKLLKGSLKYLVRYRREASTFEPMNDDATKQIITELKPYL